MNLNVVEKTYLISLGVCVLPLVVLMPLAALVLNRRFDPLLGPKPGEKWEFGKSPAFPYYFLFRSTDYARAQFSEKFAQKKFGVSKEFFTSRMGFFSRAFALVFLVSVWGTYAGFALFPIFYLATNGRK